MEVAAAAGGGREGGQKRPPLPLINELLTQGKDFTKQLKNHLEQPPPPPPPPMSSSAADEEEATTLLCESLVDKILSSYEKALSMLLNNTRTEAPSSSSSSSSSAHQHVSPTISCNKNIFKKRKTSIMGKWSEQVKVCGSMVEGPLSDGYSWRKYGQKDILGANHPRAYYRCTHRNVQGCLATKQVQRSDEDTSVFEVTYKGRHTCIQATQLSKALLEKKPKPEEEEEEEENIHDYSRPTQKMCIERVFSFKANNNNNNNNNNKSEEEGLLFPNSFSFASTPIETEKLEKLFYLGCDSTTFNDNLQTSGSHLIISAESEMMNYSTPNSSTNSPLAVDWDFSLDQEDFDGNFYFDAEMMFT